MKIFKIKVLKTLLNRFPSTCAILLYHHVVPEPEIDAKLDRHLYVPTEIFEAQLKYLIKNCCLLSIEQMSEKLELGLPFPANSVVLTFDDGHSDTLTYAYPLLRKYNVPVTIYIGARFPEGDSFLWRYELQNLILNNCELDFVFDSKRYHFYIYSQNQKQDCYRNLSSLFVNLTLTEQKRLTSELYNSTATEPLRSNRLFLSWDQIKYLDTDPLITIGTHTYSHLMLSRLNEDEVLHEIRHAKAITERNLGHSVEFLSYPYGGPNAAGPREFKLAQLCSLRNAVTTRFEHVYPRDRKNLFALPRLSINGMVSMTNFQTYLTGPGVVKRELKK